MQKLNTDEAPNVATDYGIRSIPTVMIFKVSMRDLRRDLFFTHPNLSFLGRKENGHNNWCSPQSYSCSNN